MTAWKELRYLILYRIRNGITRNRKSGQHKTRGKSKAKKPKKEICPEELIAIIASIILIYIAYGALGLVYDVYG
ncbi:MAG: hypothetical protein ACRD8W_00720 [Nitrososphaeraceae archaeon]